MVLSGSVRSVPKNGGSSPPRGGPGCCSYPSRPDRPHRPRSVGPLASGHVPRSWAVRDRGAWECLPLLGALHLIRRDFARKVGRNDAEVAKRHPVRQSGSLRRCRRGRRPPTPERVGGRVPYRTRFVPRRSRRPLRRSETRLGLMCGRPAASQFPRSCPTYLVFINRAGLIEGP